MLHLRDLFITYQYSHQAAISSKGLIWLHKFREEYRWKYNSGITSAHGALEGTTVDKVTKETKWIEQSGIPRARLCGSQPFRVQEGEGPANRQEDTVRKVGEKPEND